MGRDRTTVHVPTAAYRAVGGTSHRRRAGHPLVPVACHLMGDSTSMTKPAIELHDVTVAYDGHPAVHHVSGIFAAGSLTAIAGPNGAGKSTLLKLLAGELAPAAGSSKRQHLSRREIGYLPQTAEIDRRFPLTVADTVALGAWRQMGAFGALSSASALRSRQALGRRPGRIRAPANRIVVGWTVAARAVCPAACAGYTGHPSR